MSQSSNLWCSTFPREILGFTKDECNGFKLVPSSISSCSLLTTQRCVPLIQIFYSDFGDIRLLYLGLNFVYCFKFSRLMAVMGIILHLVWCSYWSKDESFLFKVEKALKHFDLVLVELLHFNNYLDLTVVVTVFWCLSLV